MPARSFGIQGHEVVDVEESTVDQGLADLVSSHGNGSTAGLKANQMIP